MVKSLRSGERQELGFPEPVLVGMGVRWPSACQSNRAGDSPVSVRLSPPSRGLRSASVAPSYCQPFRRAEGAVSLPSVSCRTACRVQPAGNRRRRVAPGRRLPPLTSGGPSRQYFGETPLDGMSYRPAGIKRAGDIFCAAAPRPGPARSIRGSRRRRRHAPASWRRRSKPPARRWRSRAPGGKCRARAVRGPGTIGPEISSNGDDEDPGPCSRKR